MIGIAHVWFTVQSLWFVSRFPMSEQSDCTALMEAAPVTCSPYQIMINGACKEIPCKQGFYLKEDKRCHRCHYTCKSCLTYDVCNACTGGRSLYGGTCVWKCPKKHRTRVSDGAGVKICAPRKQEAGRRCAIAEWEEWSECGTNSRTRSRAVQNSVACTGVAPIQHRFCMPILDRAAAECAVSEWLPWEQCDSSCKNKFRRRRRIIESMAEGTRKKRAVCPNLVEEEPCPCYLNNMGRIDSRRCQMGDWSDWSGCDSACGRGTEKRVRATLGEQNSFGCRSYTETRPCCTQTCRDYCTSTLLGDWSGWSRCQGSCENSSKRRARTNLFPSVLLFCDSDLLYEEKRCRKKGCGERCVMSEWGAWSECGVTNTKYRYRDVLAGANCSEMMDSMPCS